MIRRSVRTELRRSRAGMMTPLVAIALVVVMLGVALVLDRLWLEAAQLELETCAEASALAAAARLADDDRLGTDVSTEERLTAARRSAARIAAANRVAGQPVLLDIDSQGDVRFGRVVVEQSTGREIFLETDSDPRTVVVQAHRDRRRRNPVALFLNRLTGQDAADVVAKAEATIDNRVVSLRPAAGSSVPLLPLAILADDPAGLRLDTWAAQVDARGGRDRYRFDAGSGSVVEGSDGIPEITLTSLARGKAPDEANVQILDLGSGLRGRALQRQLHSGCDAQDLRSFGGELTLSGSPHVLGGTPEIDGKLRQDLSELIGQTRICFLFSTPRTRRHTRLCELDAVRLVAVRVLDVRDVRGGACEIVVQPGVITTRTAVIDPSAAGAAQPYIYKLHLTQ